ncbi:hypothetical protein [Streptomyces tsukubensis]|uniref:hypothetical protein n=1 Tax=Streptomyces tsukubensis TaxID=83656 RepID=UPI00344EA80E
MTRDKWAPVALHLLLVWAAMATAVPMLGIALLLAGWGGGFGAAAVALVLGLPLAVGLLAAAGSAARTVVPICGSRGGRLGWAVLVFTLGTLGVLGGLAAYGEGVDLGSAGARFALTGVPYAAAAALFVPDWRVRMTAVAAMAAGVGYGVQ